MRENKVLYSKSNPLDVDKLLGVGVAENLCVQTDLESIWQRQKNECFLNDREKILKLGEVKINFKNLSSSALRCTYRVTPVFPFSQVSSHHCANAQS